jgi:hypothetical protein
MASINPSVVYTEIHKLATNSAAPDLARSRIDRFCNDIATSTLTASERLEHVGRLREILITASQRNPGSAHSIFREAADALERVSALGSA